MRTPALLGALLLAGCITVDVQTPGDPLPPGEVPTRIELRQYADDLTRRVAYAADALPAGVRNDALRWKIGASTASRVAAYRFQTHLALVDTWALAVQMEQFFAAGAGRATFGGAQPQVLAATRALREEADALAARRIDPGALEGYRKLVADYAASEPLRDLSLARASIALRWRDAAAQLGTKLNAVPVPVPVPVAAQAAGPARADSGPSTVGSAAEVMADASDRFDSYGQRVPDELRWRTELALAESGLQTADLQRTLKVIEAELARLGELARTQPGLALQRLGEMQAEMTRVAGNFDRRWAQTLVTLEVERAAMMRDLEAMRGSLDATLERERKAIVAAASAERAALSAEARSLLPLLAAEARSAVSQALLLLIVLAVILLALPFFGGYLVGRARAKRG
jgi:hypothetical protein